MKRNILLAIAALMLCLPAAASGSQQPKRVHKTGVIYQVVEDIGLNKANNSMFTDEYNELNAKAVYHYVLIDKTGYVHSLPDDPMLEAYLGESVEVGGVKIRGRLQQLSVQKLANAEEVNKEAADATTTVVVQGAYKLLVVVLSLNNASRSFTEEQARKPLFYNPMSVNSFYKTASFGKLWLTGDKNPDGDVAYVNLNVNIAECKAKLYSDWANLISQELRNQNLDPAKYNGIITLYPDDSANCIQALADEMQNDDELPPF